MALLKNSFIKTAVIFFTAVVFFSFTKNPLENTAIFHYKKYILFSKKNIADSAYYHVLKAKEHYSLQKNIDSVYICNLKLYDLVSSQPELNQDKLQYLQENNGIPIKDSILKVGNIERYAGYYFNQKTPLKSSNYYHKSIGLVKRINRSDYLAKFYSNLGLLYTIKHKDSASYYFEKALKITSKEETTTLISSYINYANFYFNNKNYTKSIQLLNKAQQINPIEYRKKLKKIIYKKLADNYEKKGNFKEALKNLALYNLYKDSLNTTSQNIAISDLDKKYQTEKKEKEIAQQKQQIAESETKRKQNAYLFYATSIFLILGGTIGVLTLKNSRRKQLLATQEKELEQQKNIALLKEQELNAINAMVEGQEKERKRIAEDLHDNVGSVLATLKLHFENLKFNREKKQFNQEILYKKTENLIDETYAKIRHIAHEKNSGVIANQGLLVAVNVMAEKISSANKTKIEVVDFGLDKRLENSLEISVFRIIQELTTNILKHAEAKNSTINISQYDDELNIIIEDDGKGFNINTVELKNGMGLNSIKTRVAHLNGTFEVDSSVGKGTSIIINIPIK